VVVVAHERESTGATRFQPECQRKWFVPNCFSTSFWKQTNLLHWFHPYLSTMEDTLCWICIKSSRPFQNIFKIPRPFLGLMLSDDFCDQISQLHITIDSYVKMSSGYCGHSVIAISSYLRPVVITLGGFRSNWKILATLKKYFWNPFEGRDTLFDNHWGNGIKLERLQFTVYYAKYVRYRLGYCHHLVWLWAKVVTLQCTSTWSTNPFLKISILNILIMSLGHKWQLNIVVLYFFSIFLNKNFYFDEQLFLSSL
jgi:hypothetical protein